MMRNDFAVFILSHGRANHVITLNTLARGHYTGKIYIIVDDEDEQIAEYRKIKGVEIIVFNKQEEMKRTDTIDNFQKHKAVVYARNRCHDIAKQLGLNYFLVLDDDYGSFRYRKAVGEKLTSIEVRYFDKLFEACIEFLEKTNALSVAFAQTGDYIGGVFSNIVKQQLTRKVMNSFFCKTDRPFKFLGSINEDVNAYTLLGQQGELFFTIAEVGLNQTATQQNAGGLTDIYLDLGTYIKSFYTVICCPSCARVTSMGVTHRRIHHKIKWNNCTPKILDEKYKKTV